MTKSKNIKCPLNLFIKYKILNGPTTKKQPKTPAVCLAKPLLIWSPKGICRCIPPVWEQSLQSLECNAMKTNTTKPGNRGISHLHIFCDHLGLQRRGSPKHVSQQDLFVLGCCLFGQMSSQQWDRKTSSLILISHGKRRGKKPMSSETSHTVFLLIFIRHWSNQQWEMHIMQKWPWLPRFGS